MHGIRGTFGERILRGTFSVRGMSGVRVLRRALGRHVLRGTLGARGLRETFGGRVLGRSLVGLLGLALACAGPEQRGTAGSIAVDSATRQRAIGAADALGKDLVGMLTSELERGGPSAALAICADSAQLRTARHQLDGIHVRRIGTRVRNPANAPDSLEQVILATFETAQAAGRTMTDTTFVVPGPDGTASLRYLRAIRVQPQCLACHGPAAQLDSSVRAVIAERYPDDKAVDYAAGDLRGAISVRLPQER